MTNIWPPSSNSLHLRMYTPLHTSCSHSTYVYPFMPHTICLYKQNIHLMNFICIIQSYDHRHGMNIVWSQGFGNYDMVKYIPLHCKLLQMKSLKRTHLCLKLYTDTESICIQAMRQIKINLYLDWTFNG